MTTKTGLILPNLRQFVKAQNVWRDLRKQPRYALRNPTQKEVQELADALACELSPENLHCDGEASPEYVRQRSQYLNAVWDELDQFVRISGLRPVRVEV